jgi:3-methylfumaryl-CoA hydratase
MWAGGSLTFHQPLHIGETVTRASRIQNVDLKHGRSGTLVFVNVQHELSGANGLAITERQDIVYREAATGREAARPRLAPPSCDWSREIVPSEPLLFRYSALTFNSHRIHYDRPYAMSVEGYPALVVHGPLIATLLVDLVRRRVRDAVIETFEFRAVAALFNSTSFDICGARGAENGVVELWAKNRQGELAMEANAKLKSGRSE